MESLGTGEGKRTYRLVGSRIFSKDSWNDIWIPRKKKYTERSSLKYWSTLSWTVTGFHNQPVKHLYWKIIFVGGKEKKKGHFSDSEWKRRSGKMEKAEGRLQLDPSECNYISKSKLNRCFRLTRRDFVNSVWRNDLNPNWGQTRTFVADDTNALGPTCH